MSDVQIDVNKVIESLSNTVAQQAVRIAMLEATLAANSSQDVDGTTVASATSPKVTNK